MIFFTRKHKFDWCRVRLSDNETDSPFRTWSMLKSMENPLSFDLNLSKSFFDRSSNRFEFTSNASNRRMISTRIAWKKMFVVLFSNERIISNFDNRLRLRRKYNRQIHRNVDWTKRTVSMSNRRKNLWNFKSTNSFDFHRLLTQDTKICRKVDHRFENYDLHMHK